MPSARLQIVYFFGAKLQMSLGAPSEDISVGALVCLQKQRIKEASIFSVFMHFIRFVTSAQLHDKRRSTYNDYNNNLFHSQKTN